MLPDDIAASHAYLTGLLETCAQLPFYDVARTLRHAFEQERKKGYYALAEFMDRLPTYTKRHLPLDVQNQLNASDGLLHSLRSSLRLMKSKPENWSFWGESDLPLLYLRRKSLAEQFSKQGDALSLEAVEDKQRLARLDTIIKAVEELKRVGGLAINASDLEAQVTSSSALHDIDVSTCPLTGLPTRGRATLETTHSGHILYSFKPIGKAFFDHATLKAITAVAASGAPPLTDWAGLCREAYELEQKLLVFAGFPEDYDENIPKSFDEKKSRFLQLLYLAGGNEYKERNIFIHDDFPLAFAKDAEEFTRILKSLLREGGLEYDKPNDTPNDWVGGVRTYYNSVLISQEGMKRVKQSLEPSIKPAQAPVTKPSLSTELTHLHPALQQAVGSRFADGYYSDALHKACTALEKAVQDKANQPPEPTGATLMSKVFSKDRPILTVSANQGEQEGYMFLYRGLAQAIRNHYAHNDPATDPARALEWLGFISALFYKLEEAQLTATP